MYHPCTKLHLHTRFGGINQPDNRKITQPAGLHSRYKQAEKKKQRHNDNDIFAV